MHSALADAAASYSPQNCSLAGLRRIDTRILDSFVAEKQALTLNKTPSTDVCIPPPPPSFPSSSPACLEQGLSPVFTSFMQIRLLRSRPQESVLPLPRVDANRE